MQVGSLLQMQTFAYMFAIFDRHILIISQRITVKNVAWLGKIFKAGKSMNANAINIFWILIKVSRKRTVVCYKSLMFHICHADIFYC